MLLLDELVKSIELCCASFRIWETRDPPERDTGKTMRSGKAGLQRTTEEVLLACYVGILV